MRKEITVDEVVEEFADHLSRVDKDTTRPNKLFHMASYWNDFTGWLKFELAVLLTGPPWYCQPWDRSGEPWEPADVGLDRAVPVDPRHRQGAFEQRVDLWVSHKPMSWESLHVNLRLVFNDKNAGKEIGRWLEEFEVLQAIASPSRSAGVASMIFGVGFDDSWHPLPSGVSPPPGARLRSLICLSAPPARINMQALLCP